MKWLTTSGFLNYLADNYAYQSANKDTHTHCCTYTAVHTQMCTRNTRCAHRPSRSTSSMQLTHSNHTATHTHTLHVSTQTSQEYTCLCNHVYLQTTKLEKLQVCHRSQFVMYVKLATQATCNNTSKY